MPPKSPKYTAPLTTAGVPETSPVVVAVHFTARRPTLLSRSGVERLIGASLALRPIIGQLASCWARCCSGPLRSFLPRWSMPRSFLSRSCPGSRWLTADVHETPANAATRASASAARCTRRGVTDAGLWIFWMKPPAELPEDRPAAALSQVRNRESMQVHLARFSSRAPDAAYFSARHTGAIPVGFPKKDTSSGCGPDI